jgi:hypothetical protein
LVEYMLETDPQAREILSLMLVQAEMLGLERAVIGVDDDHSRD